MYKHKSTYISKSNNLEVADPDCDLLFCEMLEKLKLKV